MGVTYIEAQVKGSSGKQENVKFLVDSGAIYSLLHKAVWETIGLKPKRKVSFTLADGTTVERSVSEAFMIFPQGEAHTPVILGEKDDEALLGIVTLEILGLVFNPFDRTLHPTAYVVVLIPKKNNHLTIRSSRDPGVRPGNGHPDPGYHSPDVSDGRVLVLRPSGHLLGGRTSGRQVGSEGEKRIGPPILKMLRKVCTGWGIILSSLC